jgi:hypothetical protein
MLFKMGQIVITQDADSALREAFPDTIANETKNLLVRHSSGDWGTISAADAEENRLSLAEGYRVMSVYVLPTGEKLWVITEADRSSTTILTPDEY